MALSLLPPTDHSERSLHINNHNGTSPPVISTSRVPHTKGVWKSHINMQWASLQRDGAARAPRTTSEEAHIHCVGRLPARFTSL